MRFGTSEVFFSFLPRWRTSVFYVKMNAFICPKHSPKNSCTQLEPKKLHPSMKIDFFHFFTFFSKEILKGSSMSKGKKWKKNDFEKIFKKCTTYDHHRLDLGKGHPKGALSSIWSDLTRSKSPVRFWTDIAQCECQETYKILIWSIFVIFMF